MSRPSIREISRLNKCIGDDEGYHSEFDDILEEKLMKLDKEWMTAMNMLYIKSNMNRWCA